MSNVPYADFGAKLAKLRKDADMTRAQLGAVCGVAASTIVNYEHGTRIPYADAAVKLADFFHISIHELLCVEDPDLAMTQAQMLEQMHDINGKKGSERLKAVLKEVGNLAGGDLSEDQLIEYSLELSKLTYEANLRLRELYSNKRCAQTVEEKGKETVSAVQALDEAIRSMTSTDE